MSKQATTPAPKTAKAPAAKTSVTVGGTEHALAMLGLAEVGEFRAWAKRQQPNAIEAIKPYLEGMEPAVQRVMIDNALDEVRRPVAYGSPEFFSAMQTGEGLREVLFLSLRRAGADVTREASDAAADVMTLDEAGDVYLVAFGQI